MQATEVTTTSRVSLKPENRELLLWFSYFSCNCLIPTAKIQLQSCSLKLNVLLQYLFKQQTPKKSATFHIALQCLEKAQNSLNTRANQNQFKF